MCKILTIPKITDKTRQNAVAFIDAMAPLLSVANQDGIGYAAIDENGNLFGERWHKNADFGKQLTVDELSVGVNNLFGEFLTSKIDFSYKYNSFGAVDAGKGTMSAITLHTRYATSGKEFANTHPFVDKDTSLIHNGVIQNANSFGLKLSTCDSEALLINYLNKGVGANLEQIQKVDDVLNGYYAIGVFGRNASGTRVMDVIRGKSASLFVVNILELETPIFCTSAEDVITACKKLGFSHSVPVMVKEGSAFRFIKGELVQSVKYKAECSYTEKFTYKVPYSSSVKSQIEEKFDEGIETLTLIRGA